jgi:endonuclease YncB( thermonuclease family)
MWRLAALLLAAVSSSSAVAAEGGAAGCQLTAAAIAPVAAVVDSRTLRLADGTEVRLAGLAALGASGTAEAAADSEAQARAVLQTLVNGKSVAVQALAEDRYGRRLALAAPEGPTQGSPAAVLQKALLAGGYAAVEARSLPPQCRAEFLDLERTARAARLGVWADLGYLMRNAERPAGLAKARGRFVLVAGKVQSVRDRGATIYVNFGRRWSEDFTVTIAKRNQRSFVAAGLDPKSLAGRRVLVRGWVDERGGPWIEAVRPEQIEFAGRD